MIDVVKKVASLINEDVDDFDEYEGLEDEDQFSSGEEYSGGKESGLWEFHDYSIILNGDLISIDVEVEYRVKYYKGTYGSYYEPPEPSSIEIYDPAISFFKVHNNAGEMLASWRLRGHQIWGGHPGWFTEPKGLHPDNQMQLTNANIKQIGDHFTALWEEKEDDVLRYEYETPIR